MGCASTKQRLGHEDPTLLAAQTIFNVSEIEALHELFNRLSSSVVDDGIISKEELQLGLFGSSKEQSLFVDRVFQLFDSKNDGVIEFGEFVRALSVFHPEAPQSQKADFAFRLYDIWQTGFIERDEVREMILALLKESDLVLSEDIIDAIIDKTFQEVDLKGDGKIDPEEWKKFAAQNPSSLKNMTIPYLIYLELMDLVFLLIVLVHCKREQRYGSDLDPSSQKNEAKNMSQSPILNIINHHLEQP